jgi:DNA (cytosine-5)-methyltransferase 1
VVCVVGRPGRVVCAVGDVKIGSLFSGYGGLDMAVGGELAWYSEIEPAACKVMEAHYPGVPNLGDITKVDWSQVEPVDVITGGYPCQPFSNAGMRKGKDDERHLWPYVRDAIGAIRPRRAVLENVRGHLTLGFADVLADLAHMGISARWGIVRAADAGAPHNRARLFIVADTRGGSLTRTAADGDGLSIPAERGDGVDADTDSASSETRIGRSRTGNAGRLKLVERGGTVAADTSGERHGRGQRPASLGRLDAADEASARERQRTRQESGTGGVEDVADAKLHGLNRRAQRRSISAGQNEGWLQQSKGRGATSWGDYAPAIERWQHVIGRPAPAPTVHRNDRDRLNPAFVEWMMGLPEGHVTGHGLSPAQELKMLGNGVVPQQAALALRLLGVTA